jgi:multiple antibiotic resistance protein
MHQGLLQFAFTAFGLLFVVINPIVVAPIFADVTRGLSPEAQRRILWRALATAFSVAMFFLVVGRAFLAYMGVSVQAFAISGGVLLFSIAFPMLMGQRSGMQTHKAGEQGGGGADVAIFPLAIPQLAGPGTIATILLLTTQVGGNLLRLLVLMLIIAAIYLMSCPILLMAERVIARLGEGVMHIIIRVMGLVLAALGVQYILNGIGGFVHTLAK